MKEAMEIIESIENLLMEWGSKFNREEGFIMMQAVLATIQDDISLKFGRDPVETRKNINNICEAIEEAIREGKRPWRMEP